jgi:hypothetical protein
MMNREEQLLELQRRIALAKGYAGLKVQDNTAGQFSGVLHADEGRVLVPRWPWDIDDARTLLDEIHTGPVNPPGYHINHIETENGPRVRFALLYCEAGLQFDAETEPEAISLGWCFNHRVDTTGLFDSAAG